MIEQAPPLPPGTRIGDTDADSFLQVLFHATVKPILRTCVLLLMQNHMLIMNDWKQAYLVALNHLFAQEELEGDILSPAITKTVDQLWTGKQRFEEAVGKFHYYL